MPLSRDRQVLFGFIVALMLMGAVAYFVALSFQRAESEKQWVDHTYQVISLLENTISGVIDVQSAQRGYIITGKEEYTAPYYLALPNIEADMGLLKKMMADNPGQAERLAHLHGKIAQRIELAGKIIDTYDKQGQKAAFALVQAGTGKREMDEIRVLVAEMVAEERALLALRQQSVQAASALTLRMGALGTGLCFAILCIVFWLVMRESRQRMLTQVELQSTMQVMESYTQEAKTISKMGEYLQSCVSTDEAYKVIAQYLPGLLPGASGSLYLYNNSRNLIEGKLNWGPKAQPENEFEQEQCWAVRHGRIHLFTKGGDEPLCEHLKTVPGVCSICHPMQANGEIIGIFHIESDTPGFMTERRMHLIQALSEQISLAIATLRLQEKLRNQSIRDPLTQLFNRRYLEETLTREMARSKRSGEPLAVLFMDIDHFKKFNDTHGHDAGDALLVGFARVLKGNIRTEDVICRYGGEEFVVVLHADLARAQERAEILRRATREMVVPFNGKQLQDISVSIGLAVYPEHGETPEYLITVADNALYEAKHGGRNRVVVAGSGAAAE